MNVYAGYKIFQNNCKTCHFKGNSEGAPFLHSESKTARAWSRVFVTKYPNCYGQGHWASLSQEEILKLHDFLNSEARDSYNPYNAKGNC